ncbi:acyl-CoA dehydrogenase [Nocardioides sp. zg-579]|uniref:Acyl-CoA dehydrogenase n=1 Tax=Nocardioides marmotae TaxID=2663857 RepID=A0A6I3J7E5_9ACTN|nr:acyl-CoA dehydrogenase family protein [Nocardioides marmotae]MCR6030277.1 acyl-CoA dehydrogenase [Gordonia jinghuaiqii]MTB93909.1 acyl-CoA dehydrogenase [Nocardioides marmotae]QKE00230.1 acyl-CoA dehydrogenase [Nocardioides marmotae]
MTQHEDVDAFRARARAWLAATMPRLADAPDLPDEDAEWARARELQRLLHDGGFAGISYPAEYGGLGLTPAHQQAFTEESAAYEMPLLLNVPTLGICGPTILEYGSEELKQQHLPRILRGEEILVQFLSEPRGGSDLGGLITRAERVEGGWSLNGAKTWSTCAYSADWALCLARTDWDVPKHEGLTMFLVPTDAPGITMRRIRMVNDTEEFCEEFLDDVFVPDAQVLGEPGQGWQVVMRQLFHEKGAVGGGSPYVSGAGRSRITRPKTDPVALARSAGRLDDPATRELLGRWHASETVHRQLNARIRTGLGSGLLPAPAASMMMLFHARADAFNDDVALEIAGAGVVAASGPAGQLIRKASTNYLMRQASSLGGGSAEMSRNIISERLLSMPREPAPDRGVPFREVARG